MALAEALVPRMHVAERLLSLRRAQPAPPLHTDTRRVLLAERRETAWALVVGGQQGRCRGVGWGRRDGLIGYGIPTAGRLCAAPISGCGSLAGTSWPCRFECTRACKNEGCSLFVLGLKTEQ